MTTSHTSVPVVEASQPSAARFAAHDLAATAGFGETDVHRAGIVATELATNLVKHATGGGEILLRITGSAPAELELLSIDRGPGMRDVIQSLTDGHSTAGSPGNGLGSIRRMADDFDIFSDGSGTVVFARLRAGRVSASSNGYEVGAVSVAVQGEPVCGDAWYVSHRSDGLIATVVDGLGHGLHAADAAGAAIAALTARPFSGTTAALAAIHDAIRHTRGAAATIARLQRNSEVIQLSGVGNVSAAISTPGGMRQAVTQNGTLGHEARYFREYSYPWTSDSMLVMHSDGLDSHWTLDRYRGLRRRHPAIIAAVLYRDHRRQRDDVTVVVGRETRA